MSPLSDVLSRLSDEINMQEDLSHEMCPHKPEFPFIRVPIKRGLLYLHTKFEARKSSKLNLLVWLFACPVQEGIECTT